MPDPKSTFDLRTFAFIAGAALLGAAWAFFNLFRVGGNGSAGPSAALVWTVFAIPFFTFFGWLLARRHECWLAAFVCFCIYFFAVFIGARIERLILGGDAANASFHALYFRLTPIIQLIACLVAAVQRGTTRGTMHVSTES